MNELNTITLTDGLLQIGKDATNIELIDFPGARIIGKKMSVPNSKMIGERESDRKFWDDFITNRRPALEHIPKLIPNFNVSVKFDSFGKKSSQYLFGVITPKGTKVPKGYQFFDVPPCWAMRGINRKYTQALQEKAVPYGYAIADDFVITLSDENEEDFKMYLCGDIICRVRTLNYDMRLREFGREYTQIGNEGVIRHIVDEYRKQELPPEEERFFEELDRRGARYDRVEMIADHKSVCIRFDNRNDPDDFDADAEFHRIRFNLGAGIIDYKLTKNEAIKPFDIFFVSSTLKDGVYEYEIFYGVMSTKFEEFLLKTIFENIP